MGGPMPPLGSLMYKANFRGQYINFFCAYLLACAGYGNYKSQGIIAFVIILLVISASMFAYITRIAVIRLKNRIQADKITASVAIIQFFIELIGCVFISAAGIKLLDFAGQFWKLRLF